MSKLEVYFNEYNILMDKTIYFPLVSGSLQAYAQTNKKIKENYKFMPFLFFRTDSEKITSFYKNPKVVAFSISIWNTNLSLKIAKKIKKKFPKSLIVFGGPQAPFDASAFFSQYPFIDITVRGEGEKPFQKILLRLLENRDFGDIPGISYRNKSGQYIKNNQETHLEQDLDIFPSPYTNGIFNEIKCFYPDIKFQAIIETNRGCPYLCAYCSWGQGGLSKQFRFFSLKRIKQVADWCGDNKIEYVFCADSNFGIFKRDLEIAKFFIKSKIKHHGYPEKFRVCYAKNAQETVFRIGKLLHSYDMEKGISLSRQSNNPKTLANIGRKNIKMSIYNNLQKKYNQKGIPVYTELILGLPGESYKSFTQGLESIFESGMQNQIFIYPCQVYPNTMLADKKYQKKFRILTKRIPLKELHAVIKTREDVMEYEDIIISSSTMSQADWKKSMVISWTVQLFYDLKIGFFLLYYLFDQYKIKYLDYLEYLINHKNHIGKVIEGEILRFQNSVDLILKGGSYCISMPEFGNVYWGIEEASFLRVLQNKENLYKEMYDLSKNFLSERAVKFNERQLKEVIEYQKARIPSPTRLKKKKFTFSYNIPQYFEACFFKKEVTLLNRLQAMILDKPKVYMGNKKEFAKEIIIKGRKNNKLIYKIKWHNILK